jgi:retron-type reverse transcriptase
MAKNNKKSFSSNLESLFEQTLYEDNLQDNPSVLITEEKDQEEKKTTKKSKKTTTKKKSNRKSFSDGLESFFKESIEDLMGEDTKVAEVKRGIIKQGKKKAIGIELLLQRTVEGIEKAPKAKQSKTKRVTFVLDAQKIDQLKSVARKEKKHMRQIVDALIEEFLNEKN